MINDEYGRAILSNSELFDALYTNELKSLDGIFIDSQETADQFNNAVNTNFDQFGEISLAPQLNIPIQEFDAAHKNNWFMPDNYYPNLVEMLYGMCETDEQKDRVTQELTLFIQHNMMDLLYYLKYLVDTMRKHNIVWGVGRGSSTASYVLYLIGVHKIDSIKYQLKIDEFLK